MVPNGPTIDVIVGAPSPVFLNGNVNINSLMVAADGILNVEPSRNLDFGGLSVMPLVNFGDIIGTNGVDIQLSGDVINTGNISIESTGSFTDLEVRAAGAAISGGGVITLSGHPANTRISGVSNPLLTFTDQTVQGWGVIGNNSLSIDLQADGTFDANVDGETLIVDPNGDGMSNSGLMQASVGGTLLLRGGTFNNTGGVIKATDDSKVELDTNAEVIGGSIESNSGGAIEVVPFRNATVTDVSFDANVVINNGSTLSINGDISNSVTISATAESGSESAIRVESNSTLGGGGTIHLSGATNRALINGVGNPNLVITNQTIEGYGGVCDNAISLELQAGSVIDANEPGETILFDPNANGMVNEGVIRATSGGKLLFRGGTVDNTGGIIQPHLVRRLSWTPTLKSAVARSRHKVKPRLKWCHLETPLYPILIFMVVS